MYRLLPIALLIFLIAGCGSTASKKPRPTLVPVPTRPAVRPVHSGSDLVIFGTSLSGNTIHGSSSSFSKPSQLAWVAHLKSTSGSQAVTLNVERTNGPGTFPRSVWSSPVRTGAAKIATGHMSRAQMKSRHIIPGGHYTMTYTMGGKVLASGSFQISGSGSTSHVGY